MSSFGLRPVFDWICLRFNICWTQCGIFVYYLQTFHRLNLLIFFVTFFQSLWASDVHIYQLGCDHFPQHSLKIIFHESCFPFICSLFYWRHHKVSLQEKNVSSASNHWQRRSYVNVRSIMSSLCSEVHITMYVSFVAIIIPLFYQKWKWNMCHLCYTYSCGLLHITGWAEANCFFVRMLLAVSSGTAEDASTSCHKQEVLCFLKIW